MLRSKKYQYKGAYENECRKNPSSFITGLLASVTIFKVKQLFIVKDFVSQGLRPHLVYKFACAGCNTSYIGETDRHVSARGRGTGRKNGFTRVCKLSKCMANLGL